MFMLWFAVVVLVVWFVVGLVAARVAGVVLRRRYGAALDVPVPPPAYFAPLEVGFEPAERAVAGEQS